MLLVVVYGVDVRCSQVLWLRNGDEWSRIVVELKICMRKFGLKGPLVGEVWVL